MQETLGCTSFLLRGEKSYLQNKTETNIPEGNSIKAKFKPTYWERRGKTQFVEKGKAKMQTQTGIPDVCFTACDGAGGECADLSDALAMFCAVSTCCNIQTSPQR